MLDQLKLRNYKYFKTNFLKFYPKKKYRYPTEKLHRELELLLVEDIANQELLTFVHNFFSNSLPPVFDNYFDTFDHPYQTRHGPKSIRIKKHSSETAAASVLVKGASLWNALDINLKNINKRKNFRAQFKIAKVNSYDQN